ncbi:MAG: hypothetical protein ACI97A_003760 [Planctomycetota bacterium]|jgi:hypothetical protein
MKTTSQIGLFFFSLVLIAGLFSQNATAQSNEELLQRLGQLETKVVSQDAKIKSLEMQLDEQDNLVGETKLARAISNVQEDHDIDSIVIPTRSNRLKIGGQFRLRGEFNSVQNYGARIDDDLDRVIQRTRVHFDFDVVKNVRAFVQIQDSRLWGEEGSTVGDLQGLDIHQGYVDFMNVFDQPITVRVGRQELSYGSQRLVSPLDWHPVGRSWDGVKAWYEGESLRIDLFVTDVVESSLTSNGDAHDDDIFAGLYFTADLTENHTLDVYIFYRNFQGSTFTAENGSTGELEDGTAGFRFDGKASGFDYSAEGVLQFGDRAGDDVFAHAWVITLGYRFDDDWKTRVGVEWTFASGDDDPTDGDYETFDPLFPFGHAYQGYSDLFAWRNGHDFVLKVETSPTKDLWFQIAGHMFRLDSETDAWYNAGGKAIRRVTAGGVDKDVGFEIDLHFKYKLNPKTGLWVGWSHFFAGEFVEDTGKSPDSDFFYFQMTVNF